jgi:mono/diheme cytochrome c family protein
MFLTPVLTVALLFAQHAFTPEEIAEGGRLFQSNCVSCHGSAGDQVQGVALMSGKFSRASTDDDVARIIRNGVPGTAMQGFAFTEQQAGMVVAYLRSLSGSAGPSADMPALGDVARGKAIFEGTAKKVFKIDA